MTEPEKTYLRAVKILSASDKTPQALYKKLRAKGSSQEDSVQAVNRLVAEGFLNESKLLEKTVSSLYEKKYGPEYVKAALIKKDFSKKAIKCAEQMIEELDFDATRKELIKELAASGKDEAGIAAALYRRGFEAEP